MELSDISGRLDVITEEMALEEEEPVPVKKSTTKLHDVYSVEEVVMDFELPTKEPYVLVTEKRTLSPPMSSFQRFSVDTNESLHFDPFIPPDEEELRSPRGEAGRALGQDDVFEDEVPTRRGDSPDDPTSDQAAFEKKTIPGLTVRDRPDVFCADCKTPAHAFQKLQGPHANHRLILLSEAADEIKTDLQKTKRKLEEKIVQMENFAGHLEEIFLTVEENFGRQEQNLEQHYNEVLQTLSHIYDEKASGLADEKKTKLEALYNQLVQCGKTLGDSKELIETAKEIYRKEDKLEFLQAVEPTIQRIEKFTKEEPELDLSVSLEFETPVANLTDVKHMMDSVNIVPAPSAPVINPQIPNSASCTSLRVCWSLFSDDTVEYYELFYRPVLEDTPMESSPASDVSTIKVKETHCTVSVLLPNAQYEFWVTATNTTGISPASEKALYMTVPAPPLVKQRECASCSEAALIRWESGNADPVDSYTVELSQADVGSTVTESVVAIPNCECLIQLQPGKHYSFYIRAVNVGGASERSDVITISTTGTLFHLLEDTAHPCLSISEDGHTMFYGEEELPLSAMTFSDSTFARCVAVLGDLVPVRGRHYWEVEVDEGTEYRTGVAYEDTQRDAYLGGNSTSWCLRHLLTPSRHKYEFLHNGWTPDIRLTAHPRKIGVALDYEMGTLSFFNVDLRQHLYTFRCRFLHFVHPCFALDSPGVLTLHNGIEAPDYTRFT